MLASFAFAQDKPSATATAPGCGLANTKFEVKTDSQQHPIAQPESGKALLYFIEDDTSFSSRPKPTTRLGIDGNWAGATQGNSYFYLSITPGEHHLCASWQSRVLLFSERKAAAAHFTAEAGRVYYYRVKNIWGQYSAADISLEPLDSDEGQLLMSKFAFSTFHPQK